MKKFLLCLTASLTLVVAEGQTNVYHPFPEDSAKWSVNWYAQPPYCNGYCNTVLYRMSGDTMINAVSYNKLFVVSFVYQGPYSPPPPNYFSGTYIGAIRQDIPNKKVFYRKYSMTSDTLLYDFDLAIGDTLPATYLTNSLFKPTIISGIDSMLVDNKYHKRFKFYNTPAPPIQMGTSASYLLEGVGAGGGLFDLLFLFEAGPILECFSTTNSPSCEKYTVGTNETINETLFEIFPNPFSTHTILKTGYPINNATLIVYNSFGQLVKQIENISGQVITLRRGDLPSGLYFIHLTQDGKIFATDKLIVTDN